ncbi:RagB/SusD family nutrient uptake outer membrane protein [Spirosoma montaniterrae]|uniref:Carbohydrate-binding protein SusD n=1 Tax=Spirosoma montaniterrae TaxID=1178516 RepID=A0A1P9X394_9BACT|nr:RagB/SusD family nutrient uptake outer membrane protein [Spirosoma montaniterrae]AQG82065.1 hypothetical protein AWR27_23875 [Spirosoma montaniterrae]
MKKRFIPLLMALLLGNWACDPDTLDIKNQNQYSDATYFTTDVQFNEATIATYATLLHQGLYARDWYFTFDLLGNDAERNTPLLGDLAEFPIYAHTGANPVIQQTWGSLYRMIFRANLVIDRATAWNPTMAAEQTNKKQYIAEASFLRGWAQMQLTQLWGAVPLRPNSASAQNAEAPRASVAEGWAAVERDLTKAATDLPLTYPDAQLGRATRGAAVALLGKALLYQKKYAQAQAQLQQLLQAPYSYALTPNYDDLFTAGKMTNETIFAVQHRWVGWDQGNAFYMFGGQETWGNKNTASGRGMEYGWNDWQNVQVAPSLAMAFKYKNEAGADYVDPRAKLTFYGDAASGGDVDYCNACTGGAKPYPFADKKILAWRKYNNYEVREKEDLPASNISSQLIRLADVKLMLAETFIEQNNLAGALAQINDVRRRVGAFAYTSLGAQDNARLLLRRERQLELAGEQSRFFDLVRWGIAQQTINPEKQRQLNRTPFLPRHVLLPIPQGEKDTNPLVRASVTDDWN